MNESVQKSKNSLSRGSRDELRVLRALESNPELSQRQLATGLEASLGGVNYALKALVERGFVKSSSFRKSGDQARYLYLLTPKGVAEKMALAKVLLSLKPEEYEVLEQEIEALKCEVSSGDSARVNKSP